MIHYHGTPITPRSVLHELAGKHFCVSHASPNDAETCHQIGQSVMLDNGAFSAWRNGKATDWKSYYAWADRWLDYPTTWAVIPDVIDAPESDQDMLASQWPHGDRGAPVWHMNETISRLLMLCEIWPRVCIGSAGDYATVGDARWCRKMDEAFNALTNRRMPWLHMLRGMSLAGSHYPFASADSTDVARNHNRSQNSARKMANKWDAQQCPGDWAVKPVQTDAFAFGDAA